jgi:hypothetical protein
MAGMTKAILGVACALLIACRGNPVAPRVSVVGRTNQTIPVRVGDDLTVTLQSIGPGGFVSPPSVSSSAVRFLDVSDVPPFVPAGPTEMFRFEAVERGQAIIVFRHSGSNPTVEDTVIVR